MHFANFARLCLRPSSASIRVIRGSSFFCLAPLRLRVSPYLHLVAFRFRVFRVFGGSSSSVICVHPRDLRFYFFGSSSSSRLGAFA
jgi:hypothetical protein